MKTKLRDLENGHVTEKNFQLNQEVEEASLEERRLEFLYPEGKQYLFLDVTTLDQILVPAGIVAKKINYLKEGIDVKAALYGGKIFSLELPQYLELMVVGISGESRSSTSSKIAELETGAKVEVPPFIEVGDIIKVDTKNDEYIQRV